MRRKETHRLGLKHLVKHMDVWEEHLRRLRKVYYSRGQTRKYHEIQADIAKLKEWRERLDAINPRANRDGNMSLLQGSAGSSMPESDG